MEFQDVRLFIEVSKAQSFSRAAARMHMGQPSVSQRIAALEATVGKPLFTRHRHGVRLTEAGQTLLVYAERMMMLTDEAVAAVRATPADRLRVRLAGPSTVNSYLLPPLLCELADADHDVELRDAHSHEVMQHVLDGQTDVGFVIDIPGQPGIRRIPIHRDPIVCVAAPSHPLAAAVCDADPLSLAMVASHRIVFYRFSFEYDSLVHCVKNACNGGWSNFVETTPAESVKAMLRTGHYISFLPKMTVTKEISCGELMVLPIMDLPAYTWNVAMVYRDRKALPRVVTTVVNAMNQQNRTHDGIDIDAT